MLEQSLWSGDEGRSPCLVQKGLARVRVRTLQLSLPEGQLLLLLCADLLDGGTRRWVPVDRLRKVQQLGTHIVRGGQRNKGSRRAIGHARVQVLLPRLPTST